jgi:mRNA-degrading endonuclease toxin of MazEF toxin-antitoxin module
VNRGDVFLINLGMPNRQGGTQPVVRRKYVVVLNGGAAPATVAEVAVVVASTYRAGGAPRRFEALLSSQDGFDHDTVVDGRWPYTLSKTTVEAGSFRFRLSAQRMHEISVAIAAGLELY